MRKILILVLALGTLNSFAQKHGKPDKFAKTITPADLKKHLSIVASAEMEGRETATPGQKKAAAYIENQFRSLGLEPGINGSYQMVYNVYQDSLLSTALEVNGRAFEVNTDFNTSISTNIDAALRFSEITFISPGISVDSIRNMSLAGKLVMIAGNMNAEQNRGGRNPMSNSSFAAVQNKGAAAVLIIQNNYPRSGTVNKGNLTTGLFKRTVASQLYNVSENVAREIMGEAFDKLLKERSNTTEVATANGFVATYPVNILLETKKTTIELQSSNVIGVIPGTDLKDQYLFITAHYDHLGKRGDTVIYYGADDDGSGTVGVLEMAEAFAKAKAAGKGPRRTVVFMTVSGEEKGLWGSDFYTSHPIFPLDKTTANLNIDMIGRSDTDRKGDTTNYVYVVGDDKLSSDLRPISEAANKKLKLELDYKYNDPKDPNRIYFRSDHYNFAKKGVPIIFYYDGMLKADYHRPTDTPDKINYSLCARRAQLVFYTAWEMANRNEMLKRDIPLEKAFTSR